MNTGFGLLTETLRVAVTLRVGQLRADPDRLPLPADRRRRLGDLIGHKSDELMFGGPAAADTLAAVTAAVAELLVWGRGGVTVAGVHWCDPTGAACVDPDCRRVDVPTGGGAEWSAQAAPAGAGTPPARQVTLPDPPGDGGPWWAEARRGGGDGACSPWCGPDCEARP